MKKMFRCLSLTTKRKEDDDESSDSDADSIAEGRKPKREMSGWKTKSAPEIFNKRSTPENETDLVEKNDLAQANTEGNPNGAQDFDQDLEGSESARSETDDNPDAINVLNEAEQLTEQGLVNEAEDDKDVEGKKEKTHQKSEKSDKDGTNGKKEDVKLMLAQIALAEESARLRRKEKREKKRMELSKYLGINAWKCDQKFLLNYGQEPEDIRERVIIIRKRNVKKERQRRIDEFVLRSELNAAARRNKKKS